MFLSVHTFGRIISLVVTALVFAVSNPVQSSATSREPGAVVQTDEQAYDELWNLLHMDDLVRIMRDEGTSMALESDFDLLGHAGGASWVARVDDIYQPERLHDETKLALIDALDAEYLDALCDFYKSDDIQSVVDLEISARRAFLDTEVENRAREAWLNGQALLEHETVILRFVQINDLVDLNVMGALNSHYAFLRAMADADPAMGAQMTEHDILSEVYAQELDVRRDTSEWLYAFLTTAYAPVPKDVLEAYVSFSQTDAGQALNHALFDAFDRIYVRLSADLGRAVGELAAQQDL